MLWIVATVLAAAVQTARNAMQSHLTASLGTLGATQVRFLYGWPFAAVLLAVAAGVAGAPVPRPTATFLTYTAAGAVAQIAGTALLLAAMRARSFSIATAFSKTEAIQVALFGVVILGEHLTIARSAAVTVTTLGVLLAATKRGARSGVATLEPALFGIASGGMFALASIGFRGGIVALGDDVFYLRAATTLAWSLSIQTVLLGSWLAVVAREVLIGGLTLWRQSLAAGFFGAAASQLWFLALSLTAAANVRTLGLVEVLFAQGVSHYVFGQRASARESAGMALVVVGVALLLWGTRPGGG
jgi:drug/metabolite transporter (DMT)-like permease